MFGAIPKQWLLLLVLPFCLLEGPPAAAQASAIGKVVVAGTDEPVAEAQVILQAAGRNRRLQVTTDERGTFRLPVVEPGDYRLRAEAPGYWPVEYDLTVKPRQALSLAIELPLRATLTERVEVRASYADLDPAQTGTSGIFTRRRIEEMPAPLRRDFQTLAENVVPGAVLSHDNFVHVRGNELSLHQFINGVSFLDNPHAHFTPGLSPQIVESVNIITGGFAAEFGNRFGGILDITTRSGRTLGGHGSATLGLGTVSNHDAAVNYGGSVGRFGYYAFASGFQSARFLNPPAPRESHDFGNGVRLAAQIDFQGVKNTWKLLLLGDGSHLQLPNTEAETLAGRNAARRLRSQTAILGWQHISPARTLLAVSAYERDVSEHLRGTSDPVTPLGRGSRSTLTTGIKSDLTYARAGHTFKAGLDFALLRLRESFEFDPRQQEEERGAGAALSPGGAANRNAGDGGLAAEGLEAFFFRGGQLGKQVSLYAQDHFSPFRNFTVDAGARWDRVHLVGSHSQVSPRVGVAYHLRKTQSVIHFTFDRFFTPPPLEYVLLASFLGNTGAQPVGNVRPYSQNYYEAGWSQQLHPKLSLEINAYTQRGRNAFETSEISNTRLFLPTNFHRARASGAEVSLVMRQLERIGLSGRLQYAVARAHFVGPISGGFAEETVRPGESILPAFDQTHTGTASIFYRNHWRSAWSGFVFRYGSGTPTEEIVEAGGKRMTRVVRLPQHFTADFSAGINLWEKESRKLNFEFNLTNLSNRIYRISKESETTPIQFGPRRVVSGRLAWHF